MSRNTLLAASVLALIGGSTYNVAFAQPIPASTYCTPGFYVGVQGGRTDSFYSPNEVLGQAANNGSGVSTSTTSTFETNSNNNDVTDPTETVVSYTNNGLHGEETDDIGLGGRVFAGYQFMPYFAAELGFTQFAKTTFGATGIATTTTTDTAPTVDDYYEQSTNITTSSNTTTTQYSGDITEHAIDLVAKGTLPLPLGFGLYAKAGMAYMTAERDVNSRQTGTTSNSQTVTNATYYNGYSTSGVSANGTDYSNVGTYSTVYSQTFQAFRPVAGAGLDYTIPATNFDIDVSYTRYFGSGAIDSADLAVIGVNYKFA